MKAFTSLDNTVAASGFVYGWEPAQLGNALSCMANLIALSARTGVLVAYGQMPQHSALLGAPDGAFPCHYGDAAVAPAHLASLAREVETRMLGGHEHFRASYHLLGPDDLDDLSHISNSIVYLRPHGPAFIDLRRHEHQLARFAARGNGVVISSAYWMQYMTTPDEAVDLVRAHLRPDYIDGCASRRALMQHAAAETLIGVHMRRGDYAGWKDGKYLFPLNTYIQLMHNISASLATRPHRFILCSNEAIQHDMFAGLLVCTETGSPYDDFVALSKCHFVVGPPSSYANWAAYLGGAKRLLMTPELLRRLAQHDDLLRFAEECVFPTTTCLPDDWWD